MPSGSPRYVVQHHLARADHYDLRLEIDGVLVSWAVPKGPSLDPAAHRLAVRTDDHDLAHETFEGRAGSGVVQVWDRGTYRNTSHDKRNRPVDAVAALARGHLSFDVDGAKLSGGFSLIRTTLTDRSWLLIKKRDDAADPVRDPVATERTSVLTGRTMAEIAAGER